VNTRRLAPIVVLVGGLAVAGCTGSSTPSSTSSTGTPGTAASSAAPASPKDGLLNALAPMTKTSYKYTLSSGGLTGQGANDPANKTATLALTGTATNSQQQGGSITVNALAIGTDLWLKLDFGSANSTLKISTDKWFHIDATKLGANPTLPVDPNGGANTAALLKNAVDVKQTDGTHYSGTVDLTGGSSSTPLGQPDIDRLGQKAKAVPFTATVDSQGRLTEVKLDFPAVDPQIPAVTSTYSDYGTTVTATKPDPAQVQEAPDTLYQIFKAK
jgi:hypothetical protein